MNEMSKKYTDKLEILDVYYYFDLSKEYDIDYIAQYVKIYLEIYLHLHFKPFKYKINKFINCISYKGINQHHNKVNVIKNGFHIFNQMYQNLKMKNTNETWFIYLSNGNIEDVYKNIFAILINPEPSINKCLYIINKTNIRILKSYSKEDKKHNSKMLKNTLDQLFSSKKYIDY